MPPKVPPQAGQPTRTGKTVEWPPCVVVNQVFDFQTEFVASCVENPAGGEVSVLVTGCGGTAPLLVVVVFGTGGFGGTLIPPGRLVLGPTRWRREGLLPVVDLVRL